MARSPPMPDPPEAVIALLRDLVGAPSVNPPGDTTAPARVAKAWLAARGMAPETVAADPRKPNLLVRIENGPGPSLGLNAHLDTVSPGDETAWSVPPFALTERGGHLIGLGAGNMKAAAAAMMSAAHALHVAREAWSGTLTLTLVSDECVFGPAGAAHLLDARPEVAGEHLICGEGPGGMGLAVAEKGLMWVRLDAEGRAGQGMLTEAGGSATARLARALVALDALNERRVTPPLPALDHPGNAEGLRLSVNVGRIGGGGFISRAASEAWSEIDLRLPPGLAMAEIGARLDALCAPRSGLAWRLLKGWEANWSDPESTVARAVGDAARAVRGEAPPLVTRLPASDASRWRARGVPAVCYGPQMGLASGIDDAVRRVDVLDCAAVYRAAALRLLAAPAGA